MIVQNENTGLVPIKIGGLCNKSINVFAIQRSKCGTADYVPHVSTEDIRLIAAVANQQKRHGERNSLLVKTLFDSVLRCSEGIGVRPCDLVKTESGWTVTVLGKGCRPGIAAISPSLVAELQSYAYRHHIGERDKIFPISRSQAFRIICKAFDHAGVRRPSRSVDRVGAVHVLRHSGAVERLKQHGNPRALQTQLRHKTALMTLRYLKTISVEESLKLEQSIDFHW